MVNFILTIIGVIIQLADTVLSALLSWLLGLAGNIRDYLVDIIVGMFSILSKSFGYLPENDSYFANYYGSTEAPALGNLSGLYGGIQGIAVALALFLLIYGFIVENLDFHIQDGWNIVIRFLVKVALITPAIYAWPKIGGMIINIVNGFKSNGNGIASGFNTESILKSLFYIPSGGDLTSFTQAGVDGFSGKATLTGLGSSLMEIISFGFGAEVGISNWLSDYVPSVMHLVACVLIIVLTFSVVKKMFKVLIDFSLPYIEFAVLITFVPLAIAFYASRSTMNIGQRYFRKLVSIGCLNSFRLLGLYAITKLPTILGFHNGLTDVVGSYTQINVASVNIDVMLPGSSWTVLVLLIVSVLSIHIAEAFLNKSEQLIGTVLGQ